MHKYIIHGGNKLNGAVSLKAAKNSVLALIAASVLTEDDVVLKNCPDLVDIANKLKIINSLGAKALYNGEDIFINAKNASDTTVSYNLTKTLRSSFVLLGPMLSRFKRAKICLPGGCAIGKRPVNIHLNALKALNVKIKENANNIVCDAADMRGGDITFDFPSVGATQNIMMAAVYTRGVTTIKNAAKEPEIVDLQNMLNLMGAKIKGAGTSVISIEGAEKLHGAVYTPIPDRIVAGTLIIAAAICGGDLTLRNCRPYHVVSLFEILKNNYCEIEYGDDRARIKSDGRLKALPQIYTAPYPFFPTDLQPQITALASVCNGITIVKESMFENRFGHVGELEKMGARIFVDGRTATICGTDELRGAGVTAHDLRSGAALTLAAMRAKGIS
ncbi:MAG: UDP-N-acetylglucosamine 1-carboxyvinyltransferase, partial [Clostridiales bacterium]|nr:UDP-N-acetylglucosamine 1-carboxyvinyltransferase [Clostridiales bacterium]